MAAEAAQKNWAALLPKLQEDTSVRCCVGFIGAGETTENEEEEVEKRGKAMEEVGIVNSGYLIV